MLSADPSGLELLVFRALNADRGPVVDLLAAALSARAFGFATAALLLLVGARLVRPVALVVGMGLAIAVSDGLGSQLLKPFFARRRPCYALEAPDVRCIGAAADVGSMPSLHAANFFALALLATVIDRRLAVPAFALAAAVALSRVYLGVHWPGDILAGACWGAFAGTLGALVLRYGRRARRAADGAAG